MGYELEALVATESLLRKHQSTFHNAHVVPVAQGLALIPMTHTFYEEINRSEGRTAGLHAFHPIPGSFYSLINRSQGEKVGLHGFAYLSSAVEAWAVQISRDGAIAYIEVNYWGNEGAQRSIVWRSGLLAAGPFSNVDDALGMLGMEGPCVFDDEDSAGFGKHRRTESW